MILASAHVRIKRFFWFWFFFFKLDSFGLAIIGVLSNGSGDENART